MCKKDIKGIQGVPPLEVLGSQKQTQNIHKHSKVL